MAVECARRGASVVLGCRNVESAGAVSDEIRMEAERDSGVGSAVVIWLDLGSLDSVSSFVQSFLDRFDRLDILVNNAGRVHFHSSSVFRPVSLKIDPGSIPSLHHQFLSSDLLHLAI